MKMNKKSLKIAISVIQLNFAFAFGEPLPECTGQDVVFARNPQDAIVTCGTYMRAEFHCQYTYQGREGTERPWWTIGSTTYRTNLPKYHDYDGSTKVLHVANITLNQNNTMYTCEFHTRENGFLCAYRSRPGILKIFCFGNFQCDSYYQYKSVTQPAVLKQILTTISQINFKYFISGSIIYTILFSNSISGAVCGSDTFLATSGNCDNEVCKHNFNISTSACLHNKNINVSVWVAEYHGDVNFSLSDPIQIDTFNNFVSVSFDRERSIVNCSFSKESMDSKKVCSVNIGPVTTDCQDLPSEPVEGEETHSSYVSFEVDLSFLGDSHSTKFCFAANASAAAKTVIVEGIYDTASTPTAHQPPASKILKAVFLTTTCYLICLTLVTIVSISLKRYSMSRRLAKRK